MDAPIMDYARPGLRNPGRAWTASDYWALIGLAVCVLASAYYVYDMHYLVPTYWREMAGDCGTGRTGVRMRWGKAQDVFFLAAVGMGVACVRRWTLRVTRVVFAGALFAFVLCELNRAGVI